MIFFFFKKMWLKKFRFTCNMILLKNVQFKRKRGKYIKNLKERIHMLGLKFSTIQF